MPPSPWDTFVFPFIRFFSGVGEGFLSGSVTGELPQNIADQVLYHGEQAPLVVRILSEVKTGWSVETIVSFWGPLLQIPILITLVFGASMIYCAIRVFQIRQIERIALQVPSLPHEAHDTPRMQLRWRRVLEAASSDDPHQWRSAVLEADHILNELLDTLGYKGETIGDKMKTVDVAAFRTIDFAWEAHQVRNRIAQDPAFVLDARETRRIIKMYERVFEEFHFISEGEHH